MDKQTQATLREITRNIPAELTNVTKEVVDKEEEDRVLALIRDPRLPAASKRRLQRLVNKGAFRTEETVVDEEKVKKLDEYHTNAIKKAQEAGRLADPNEDKFNKERQWRVRNRKKP